MKLEDLLNQYNKDIEYTVEYSNCDWDDIRHYKFSDLMGSIRECESNCCHTTCDCCCNCKDTCTDCISNCECGEKIGDCCDNCGDCWNNCVEHCCDCNECWCCNCYEDCYEKCNDCCDDDDEKCGTIIGCICVLAITGGVIYGTIELVKCICCCG